MQKRFVHKTAKRRITRYSLLAVNLLLLLTAVWLVVRNPQKTIAFNSPSAAAQSSSVSVSPLDQLSSADIAMTVARLDNLPETTAVTNQAQTENAEQAIIQSSVGLIDKPQVVATVYDSNQGIKTYAARTGDTVESIAAMFDVTSDSIRWSNDLAGNTVTPGQVMFIPPVNGIVYSVKAGDTPASLAQTYHANAQLISEYNDAELVGLKPGERIIIPNGQEQNAVTAYDSVSSLGGGGVAWGTSPIYGYNGYDFGFCTWYVATQISVPANWGNASSWAYYAGSSGWSVSSKPTVGAIAQTPYAAGGEGHVAVVDAVSANGTMIKYRDMNGIAGWDRVGYSGWVPAGTYPNYISH